MEMQTTHAQNKFKPKKFPIVLVCDKIRTPENIGMIFRVAESFGVEEIILDKESPSPADRSVKRISRDANKQVKFEVSDNLPGEIEKLKLGNYQVFALEITSDSKPVTQLKIKKEKIVLVLGAERNGISRQLLELCDEAVHIDMYGNNSSMNVVNALSVALYEITNKFLKR
jgi:tRNA G18 (ribose-2'-O)-methylase SpoU